MAVELTNEERETCLNMVATDRNTWEVFSDDPVMQGRLERIGAELVRSEGPSKFYRLDARQVLLRKIPAKRHVSDAHLAALHKGRARVEKSLS